MSENKQAFAPSKGYRWLVFAGGLIISLAIGLLYLWSIYVKPICAQYGWNTDQVAIMGNVMVATLCLGAFIGGQLLPRIGPKACGIIGAVMFGGFMFISSFVTSPSLMYITYGVIVGTGVGLLYNAIMYTLGFWFPDKRGFVMGCFLGVFGLSTTIWSAPINSMLNGIGVKATMMILGIVFFAIIFLISVFILRKPPEGWMPEGYMPPADKGSANTKALTVKQGLKTKEFWMITAAQVLLCIPYNFISSYVAVYSADVKLISADAIVTIVAAMGIGSFSGRLIGGILADKIGNKGSYIIGCLASIIGCAVLMPASGAGLVGVMFFLLAFGYGARTPVYGTLAVDNFGVKNSSALAGVTSLFSVITCLLSGIMTAAIKNSTGSYNGSFYIAIAAAVIGCLCVLLLPKIKPVDKLAD